jgi:hypothetical protein
MASGVGTVGLDQQYYNFLGRNHSALPYGSRGSKVAKDIRRTRGSVRRQRPKHTIREGRTSSDNERSDSLTSGLQSLGLDPSWEEILPFADSSILVTSRGNFRFEKLSQGTAPIPFSTPSQQHRKQSAGSVPSQASSGSGAPSINDEARRKDSEIRQSNVHTAYRESYADSGADIKKDPLVDEIMEVLPLFHGSIPVSRAERSDSNPARKLLQNSIRFQPRGSSLGLSFPGSKRSTLRAHQDESLTETLVITDPIDANSENVLHPPAPPPKNGSEYPIKFDTKTPIVVLADAYSVDNLSLSRQACEYPGETLILEK